MTKIDSYSTNWNERVRMDGYTTRTNYYNTKNILCIRLILLIVNYFTVYVV